MAEPTIDELKAEVSRLEGLVSAYNKEAARTEGGKVLSVEMDTAFPPKLTITAPGMDEPRIAAYLYDFYALLFATYADITKHNAKAIKSARRIYLECATVVDKYGHAPCAAELRRRGEQFPAVQSYSEDVTGTVLNTIETIGKRAEVIGEQAEVEQV